MKSGSCKCKLSAISLAVAFGVVSALSMMLFAWSVHWSGHGAPIVAQWAEIFPGFAPTMKGGWIGGAWGFVEGFITGLIFAWVYNFCLCCCKTVCGTCEAPKEKSSKKA